MKEEKYNGWTNYATWRVNLEIFDGLPCDGNGEKVAAENCRYYAEEVVSDGQVFRQDGKLSLDYEPTFLDGVNWQEIADHLNEGLNENA
jgi:hypothetical protein